MEKTPNFEKRDSVKANLLNVLKWLIVLLTASAEILDKDKTF